MKIIARFDLHLMRESNYRELLADFELLKSRNLALDQLHRLYPSKYSFLPNVCSYSQLGQDLFVLETLNFKRHGFFVEFGATNGKSLSNTYTLEKNYAWTGILVEPGRYWRSALRKNRDCILDYRCVFGVTGKKVDFLETETYELSTIKDFADLDLHRSSRESSISYSVDTVSLLDLLEFHNAPRYIDYISVDTEGSELEILQNFDFESYNVKIWTIEHNFTKNREEIHKLMLSKGYIRTFETYSQFDDWYVRK